MVNVHIVCRGIRCVTLQVSQAKPPEVMSHDVKNMKLNRPMSPHLSIYKPQLTSMMSISHRATGLIMIGYALVLAGASFTSYDVPRLVSIINDMHISGGLMFVIKYLLAFPVAYHMMNGVRHLVSVVPTLYFSYHRVFIGFRASMGL
ncbi:hypothetical protein AAG570_008785 [Ranatra chinensis]|uniref:Succinate dehydrogenase cytochrome b560 subunit, mitochondrial n=1 Tax=Ranatra chinensis TaxID=642074 RepID=A0ABD0YRV9_9HEMI